MPMICISDMANMSTCQLFELLTGGVWRIVLHDIMCYKNYENLDIIMLCGYVSYVYIPYKNKIC